MKNLLKLLRRSTPACLGLLCAFSTQPAFATLPRLQAVDYDIVYVRQPRFGDLQNSRWPEVFHPAQIDPGADLMLLHPDGSEEVLIDCTDCAVTDPVMSFDGQWVYYSYFYNMQPAFLVGGSGLPLLGADVYRLHLPSRAIEQLTFGEFTPNTGVGQWDESNPVNPGNGFDRLGYGILNLGPMPLPGDRLAFTSNRNGFTPPKTFTDPTLQLFVMDIDGENIEAIAPMSIGSALHPTVLRDGRLMFSSYESQGMRDRRAWGIWTIQPDGRHWEPLISSTRGTIAFHFMTQLSNGDVIADAYYNLNNNGFGALYGLPTTVPEGTPRFHSAFPADNPPIALTSCSGCGPTSFKLPFTPWGFYPLTPMTHHDDHAAPEGADGQRVGKFTHPSGAPGNDLLVAWTAGPANDLMRPLNTPYYDSGLYLIPDGVTVWQPADLILLKNDPAYNEAWPRAVVPYSAVHGVSQPDDLSWLPNDGSVHDSLPAGTAYGLVGTSSFYKRESFPGKGDAHFDGLDTFNTSENGTSDNWSSQGADAGLYSDSEIWAVRVLAMEPDSDIDAQAFDSHARERLRILGEIPLRKFNDSGEPVLDPEGNPDTSFLARLPADTPFTFQTIDRFGAVLNMAQTWHQVRPGEVRTDCGGCHAHSQQPLDFAQTAAGQAGFVPTDLAGATPLITLAELPGDDPGLIEHTTPLVDVEFYRDVRPILQQRCVSCHNGAQLAGNLNLNDLTMHGGLPGDYKRLADDQAADWGHPPVISNGVWRQQNASRYVRRFQARRSLLTWYVYGQRMDGWDNADHPTESVPGDAGTLPAGAHPNQADLDFVPSSAHPQGGIAGLSGDEKLTIARWIDLGCPIENAADGGWFIDELRPTLTVSMPRPNLNSGGVDRIRVGLADANTGLDMGRFSLQASFTVHGLPPGSELSSLATQVAHGVYEIVLQQPLALDLQNLYVYAQVADLQGNIQRVDRRFHTPQSDLIFAHGFE